MATTNSRSTRSRNGPVLPISSAFQRSISPSGRFAGAASSGFAASSSTFAARSTTFFNQRASSPTRVHLVGASSPSPSVRFSLDSRPTSPGRSFSVKKPSISAAPATRRRTCMCSPTNHPGSFRCSLHKNLATGSNHRISSPSNQLNMRRSAMTNSLVRIGTVEGELVKRALAALIRPCAHQQRRRAGFQPRPSRLSIMSKADDL